MGKVTKFIGVYARVSSSSQSHASQMPALERYMESAEHPCRLFQDVGTGRNFERKAWQQLWNHVESGNVYAIVIYKLDRCGRNCAEMVRLFDDLRKRNVNLISLTENIDLQSISGRLLSQILAAVSAFELEVRRERQSEGIKAALAAGRKWGGRPKNSRNQDVQKKAESILKLYQNDVPVMRIANMLKVSRPTVYSVIKAATSPQSA